MDPGQIKGGIAVEVVECTHCARFLLILLKCEKPDVALPTTVQITGRSVMPKMLPSPVMVRDES
jgi:hypothetical protein